MSADDSTDEQTAAPGPVRAVDAIADAFVEESIRRHPELATYLGVPGQDHAWSDYSPEGHADQVSHLYRTLADLYATNPVDDRESVAKEAMVERLQVEAETYEAHIVPSRVSVIAGAAQEIRSIFDLMPTETEEHWRNIAARLDTVATPLQQSRQTLTEEAGDGNVSAVRQIVGTVEQIRAWTGEVGSDDFFFQLAQRVPGRLGDRLRADVAASAATARTAFSEFADWMETDLLPLAPSLDAVGEERYQLGSRDFLGATIDLAETYAWGWEELHRIQELQRDTATQLIGSPDIQAACAALDADPERRISGAHEFRRWMQQLADRAIADLAGTHFDIPDEIRTIECCLAPTHDGAIYYTGPTEDFSRPGRMWWAVPDGITEFSTWKEVTTVYHEGVPGHHLQIGQNAHRADLLNRWQRQLCLVSGHGEGWALYAERLMEELGHLDDPGNLMGMLDAQAFRAARVIIDIGMHLQLEIPADNPLGFHPGERWTPSLGLQFLTLVCSSDEATLRFELDRYLGWPGQAPAYKVGERIWLEAREEARRRKGAAFDLRQFHADALNLGSLGLDPLRQALARL